MRGSHIEVLFLRGRRERSTRRAMVGAISLVRIIIIRHAGGIGGWKAGFFNHLGVTRRLVAA